LSICPLLSHSLKLLNITSICNESCWVTNKVIIIITYGRKYLRFMNRPRCYFRDLWFMVLAYVAYYRYQLKKSKLRAYIDLAYFRLSCIKTQTLMKKWRITKWSRLFSKFGKQNPAPSFCCCKRRHFEENQSADKFYQILKIIFKLWR